MNLGYPAIIIPIPSFGVEVYRSINPLAQMVKKGAERRCDFIMSEYIYIILYICIIWLVAWNMNFIFPCIGNVIIPTDELICFRGVGIPPTRNYHHTTMAFRHVIISYYIIEYHRHSHRWIFRCHEATRDLPRAAHHGVPL